MSNGVSSITTSCDLPTYNQQTPFALHLTATEPAIMISGESVIVGPEGGSFYAKGNMEQSSDMRRGNALFIKDGASFGLANLGVDLVTAPAQGDVSLIGIRAYAPDTKVTVRNATVNITGEDTEHSLAGAALRVSNGADVNFGTLSIKTKAPLNAMNGIELTRFFDYDLRTRDSTIPKLTINDLTLEMSGSSSKSMGGIFVQGKDTELTLGNSRIVLKEDSQSTISTDDQESYGMKIGGYDYDIGHFASGGMVISKGHLAIDTTQHSKAIPIIVSSQEAASLNADTDSSSSDIRSASVAVKFDRDKNTRGNGNVYLRNVKMSTTSQNASLIQTERFISGTMTISGQDSIVEANSNGWLIDVGVRQKSGEYFNFYRDDGFVPEGISPITNLTVNVDDGAVVKGMTIFHDKQTTTAQPEDRYLETDSYLTVNVRSGGVWQLKPKGNDYVTTLTQLNLENGGILDVGSIPSSSGYIVRTMAPTVTFSGFLHEGGESVPFVKPAFYNNGGIIRLDNSVYTDSLVIEGNYQASGEARLKMNTHWDEGKTDLLSITGTASGVTQVIPVSITTGEEGVIDGSVDAVANTVVNTGTVVRVGTSGDTQAFTGTARSTGISEIQLAKRVVAGADEYYWTGTITPRQPETPPPEIPPTIPETPPEEPPAPTEEPVVIVSPEIPAYVNMQRVNLEQNYASIGTLHERRGENQTLAWDDCGECGAYAKGQTWGRIYGKHLEQDGKTRFDLESNIYGIQFGHDFRIKRGENGSHQLTGAYFSYSHSDNKFYDQYRAENGRLASDKYMGKGESDVFSLGLNHTYYAANGTYLDLVGQLTWLHNKYKARNVNRSYSQNGWGVALSAEVGRPFALNKHAPNEAGWLIEPQAQLIYQHLKLDNFKDDLRTIKPGSQDALRGRLGVRVAYNAEGKHLMTNTFYAVANVWHDFAHARKITIGPDTIRETFGKTWAEVGVGAQMPIAKQAYLYGDIRYERNLGGAKRSGYRGSIGAKFTWK